MNSKDSILKEIFLRFYLNCLIKIRKLMNKKFKLNKFAYLLILITFYKHFDKIDGI